MLRPCALEVRVDCSYLARNISRTCFLEPFASSACLRRLTPSGIQSGIRHLSSIFESRKWLPTCLAHPLHLRAGTRTLTRPAQNGADELLLVNSTSWALKPEPSEGIHHCPMSSLAPKSRMSTRSSEG